MPTLPKADTPPSGYPALLACQRDSSTQETRAAVKAAMLLDIPVARVSLADLSGFARLPDALPVGTVEFVHEAMRNLSIAGPSNISYPDCLHHLLRRHVRKSLAGHVLGRWFVKPCTTKAFTGFVFDSLVDPDQLDAHDREQHDAFMALPPDAEVWISEVVEWLSEWRYYVLDGQLVGEARYDQLDAEDAPQPDAQVVQEAVALASGSGMRTLSIDMGVLRSGETALVECNDAYALGLYGNAVECRDYLRMLEARWREIRLRSDCGNGL